MNNRISRIRDWLQGNKIFFEVLSLLGLGSMSIILSIAAVFIAAVFIAHQQAAISERQLEVSHIAQSPFLWVEEYLIKNQESGIYEDQVLEISNEGYRLSGFSSEFVVFFIISNVDLKAGKLVAYVPVNGYYSVTINTGKPTGTLATCKGFKYNLAFGNLYKEFLERSGLPTRKFYSIERFVVVRVSYQDYAGKVLTEYLVPSSSGGRRISLEEGTRWFNKFVTSVDGLPEELTKLTADRIIWYLENRGEKRRE